MNIAEFLNSNTAKFPHKSAIGFKKKDTWTELSWVAFRRIVFKTANALKNAGAKPGDNIAIFSENSAEWIVFDLAIFSIGAVSIPIYSTNNIDQTKYILQEAQCKIMLVATQEQYDIAKEILADSADLQRIVVSKKAVWIQKEHTVYFEDFIKDAAEELEIAQVSDEDLATIIYTSGTTGIPKGVMLTHGNLTKSIASHFDFFKFKDFENETSLAFLPLTHVFERSWTLLSLTGGAKVYFLENTKLIAKALTEVKPTMMCSVPRFYQKIYGGIQEMVATSSATKKKIFSWALKTGGELAELKQKNLSVPFGLQCRFFFANQLVFSKIKKKLGGKLWFMPCGGASISEDVTRFFDAMGIHLTVGYGLTETTATLTAFPFVGFQYGTAGKPLGESKIKIGENNEILAKGNGVMKGYYKKPEDTAAVFTDDGWFRTGDAGRFDQNGNLIITDRIKDLMKTSNGKYIAPQPIENLLSNDNLVQQVMLVAEGKPFVSALIVPNFEFLLTKLKELKIPFTTWKEIVELHEIKELYKNKIDELQHAVSGVEKVKKFTLMPMEFEISSGEITPTLKIKRNIVLQKYQAVVDAMYL